MSEQRMQQSQQIAKHPEIVERVKAKAKEADDIPTRTAVISEIYRTGRQANTPLVIV